MWHVSLRSPELPAASLSVASSRGSHLARPRARGRVFDPKYPKAKLASLPGRSCHTATGTRIVPWRQPGDWAIIFRSPPPRFSAPSPNRHTDARQTVLRPQPGQGRSLAGQRQQGHLHVLQARVSRAGSLDVAPDSRGQGPCCLISFTIWMWHSTRRSQPGGRSLVALAGWQR